MYKKPSKVKTYQEIRRFLEAEEVLSRVVKVKELGRIEEALARALPDRRRPR